MSATIKPVAELVVPAQGWTIVGPEYDEEENSDCQSFWRTPVIAFLIQTFRRSTDETTFVGVSPITANGDVSELQEYALQYGEQPPFFTIFEDFADEAALLAHFNERARLRATSLTSSQPGTGKAAPARRSGVVNG